MQLKQPNEIISDLREIARWYEFRSPGIGDRFLAAVEDGMHQILAHPLAWPSYRGGTRKYLVRDFPFLIFYVTDNETVTILAVVHTSRRPGFWEDRPENEN